MVTGDKVQRVGISFPLPPDNEIDKMYAKVCMRVTTAHLWKREVKQILRSELFRGTLGCSPTSSHKAWKRRIYVFMLWSYMHLTTFCGQDLGCSLWHCWKTTRIGGLGILKSSRCTKVEDLEMKHGVSAILDSSAYTCHNDVFSFVSCSFSNNC